MLNVCTWFWGKKYSLDYLAKLAGALNRNLRQQYRFLVFTDEALPTEIEGIERHLIPDRALLSEKGCLARLRLFDPEWQEHIGIAPNERVVNVDLDVVITRELDVLFTRPESFVIFQGANAANPCPYNGSLFMLRAWHHSKVWKYFSLERLAKTPFYKFPDDQGWLHSMIPNAAGWTHEDGVYGFKKRNWPPGEALPKNARLVAFFGSRDPSQALHIDWVKENWAA